MSLVTRGLGQPESPLTTWGLGLDRAADDVELGGGLAVPEVVGLRRRLFAAARGDCQSTFIATPSVFVPQVETKTELVELSALAVGGSSFARATALATASVSAENISLSSSFAGATLLIRWVPIDLADDEIFAVVSTS